MFRFATERPVAVFMITAAFAFFGLLSYGQLGLELMPDLAYPTLTVRTELPGAAPQEIESEITHHIEQRVGTVEALVGMHSSSRAGRSDVVLEFDWDVDMDHAAQRVRERLARLDLDTPEKPVLLRYDPSMVPVMSLGIAGTGSLTTLRTWAEEVLAPELGKISGVATVRVLGGAEPEIEVRLNPATLAARGLTIAEIGRRLASANVNIAGGTLKEGTVEFLVRTLAEIRTPEALGQVIVYQRDGVLLRLADVAQITPTTQEQVSMVRVDGVEAVRIDIFRQAGANIVDVCDTVRAEVFGTEQQQKWIAEGGRAPPEKEDAEKEKKKEDTKQKTKKKGKHGGDSMKAGQLAAKRRNMTNFIAFRRPSGSKIVTLGDQSVFIRSALDEVRSAALLGGLLAIIILYLFLQSAYATLVVAIAIPLSIAVSFVPLMMFGVSLNIMSLGGLALGVGMLVDNSVVVLESIYRCREEGDGIRAAAIRGAEEVGGAVIASTLTTIAVFFPIVFVEGIAGQVFGDLALAVVCSLLASLLVALFVVPMMASRVYDLPQISSGDRLTVALRGLPEWWAVRERPWLRFAMPLLLPYAILRTIFELLGSALMVALVVILAPLVLLAKVVRALASVTVRPIAMGTSAAVNRLRDGYAMMLRATLRAPFIVVLGTLLFGALAWWIGRGLGAELIPDVRQGVLIAELRFPVGTPLIETARRTAEFERRLQEQPHVERVEAFLGEPEAGDDDAVERGPHTASITVRVEGDTTAEADVVDSIRDLAHDLSGVDLKINRPALFSLRPPIRVVILGHELDRLAQAAEQIRVVVADLPMVDDVRSSVRPGFPELQIRYDRMRLAALGLQPREVADRLRDQVQGTVPTALRDAGHRTDVRIRAQPESVGSRQDLKNLVINPGASVPLPLEAVAQLNTGEGPAEIRHVDGQRAATITGRTSAFDLRSVSAQVAAAVETVDLPSGFDVRLQGQDEEMKTSLKSLLFALLLAVFLVYVVMASQFESVRIPLVIMGSLPLAAIGVLLVLGVIHMPLSVVVFIGLITLAGIVVNNAIVLVDYAQRLLDRGQTMEDAVINAGRARLRPILMTTATTVLGLLPLALGTGEGAELRRPIAVTLIAGLVFSTGLTLVVIPVLFRWLTERKPVNRN